MSPPWHQLRAASPADITFVKATWIPSWYWSGGTSRGPWSRVVGERRFSLAVGAYVDALLRREDLLFAVACVPESPAAILGWLIARPEQRIVDFCFVKKAFRRQGLARELLEAVGLEEGWRFYALTRWSRTIVKPGLSYDESLSPRI